MIYKCHCCSIVLGSRAKAYYHFMYKCKKARQFKKRKVAVAAPTYKRRRRLGHTQATRPHLARTDIVNGQELSRFQLYEHELELESAVRQWQGFL